MAEPLLIKNFWALGDTICLTAAIRDLNVAHPEKYKIKITGNYSSIWANNPHAIFVPSTHHHEGQVIVVNYRAGISASQRGAGIHFLTWFHKILEQHLKIKIPVTKPHGELFFSKEERPKTAEGRFWLIVAGGKLDMTTKWWPFERYQEVVDALAAEGIQCIQAGANMTGHVHPILRRCISAVGATDDVRNLFRLIRDCEGVICGVTGAMHIAAALKKPCVVIAGGREERLWEAYTNENQWCGCPEPVNPEHKFLDTLGKLPCCVKNGCWRRKVVPLHQQDYKDGKDLCLRPIINDVQPVAECMTLIKPKDVVNAVVSYYNNKILPPISSDNQVKLLLPITSARKPNPIPKQVVLTETKSVTVNKTKTQKIPLPLPSIKTNTTVLDHPTIGGKFTVFVLCYGNFPQLAKTCINSILESLPQERLDIRVALNQCCPETKDYIHGLGKKITKIYTDDSNRRKYPAMREMFHDTNCPITTPYLVWFDDDTKVVNPDWANILADTIIKNHASGGRCYGTPYVHHISIGNKNPEKSIKWFQESNWWRNKPMALRDGITHAPGGSAIRFVAGYFWAMATEMIKKADIPDVRLNHNGGDITIGAQIHQAGGKIVPFNLKKSYVWCPTREQGGRRGYSEQFPWLR